MVDSDLWETVGSLRVALASFIKRSVSLLSSKRVLHKHCQPGVGGGGVLYAMGGYRSARSRSLGMLGARRVVASLTVSFCLSPRAAGLSSGTAELARPDVPRLLHLSSLAVWTLGGGDHR